MLRESGREHFNGCLVIPIINRGEVIGMYGRKILDHLRPGTAYHLYLPPNHTISVVLDAVGAPNTAEVRVVERSCSSGV